MLIKTSGKVLLLNILLVFILFTQAYSSGPPKAAWLIKNPYPLVKTMDKVIILNGLLPIKYLTKGLGLLTTGYSNTNSYNGYLNRGLISSLIPHPVSSPQKIKASFEWFREIIPPCLSLVNSSHFYYITFSTIKTILIFLLLFLLWKIMGLALHFILKHADVLKSKFPEYEDSLVRYSKSIKKLIYLLLLVIGILFTLEAWGLEVFQFFARYSGFINLLIRIPLILILSMVLIQASRFIIVKVEAIIGDRLKSRPGASEIEMDKQVKTVGGIIYKTLLIIIIIMAIMMIMKELGFDIKPFLASAGIVGLAVGFGAQNLVRDVISGLFMIIENQIRVGDVAILNGTGGLVEAINLRTTVLRGLDGALHVFPNGAINSLSNLTHNFSFYVFDIGVAYKEDVDRVIKVLKKISEEILNDPTYGPEIVEPLEILGLDKFGDSAIVIKARIKTKPIKQWMIGREMNRRIKVRFDEEGIEIPFPHRTLYFGEVSKAFDLRLLQDEETRNTIKGWVKEAISEDKDKE